MFVSKILSGKQRKYGVSEGFADTFRLIFLHLGAVGNKMYINTLSRKKS